MLHSILRLKKKFTYILYISIYIYIYLISIYIYWKKERRLGMQSFQKNATFCILLCSFVKELCILLHSLQKKVAFFAFFYILCKRMLHSLCYFTFLRKQHKKKHHSFGFHKSPKTWKKNVACFKRTQKNDVFRT